MQKLSIRLYSVAALVKQDAAIVDIGTDHGYIPVYLAQKGVIKSAVASDINEGPLSSCKNLVSSNYLEDVIKTRISDGLDDIDENVYDTIIIAGMGGDLIVDILSRGRSIRDKHIILQPMTHLERVRKFLYDNGFEINNDLIVKDGRHDYNVMDAHYTGVVSPKNRVDYYLGNIQDFSNREYFSHLLSYFKNKSRSGEDFTDIISALEKLI